MSFVSRVTGPAARAGRSVYRRARSGLNKLKNFSRQKAYRYEEPAPGTVFSQRAQYERLHQGESPADVFSSDTMMRRAAKVPAFTVIMAVSDPRPDRFEDSMISVLSQTWAGFEFIVADCGMKSAIANVLADYDDDRIRHFRLQGMANVSDALNSAALHASGDYIVFLDYADLLTPDALFETAVSIMSTGAEILYSDEDCCDSAVRKFFSPYIKPDFNKDYLFASPYITHMLVIRRELFLAMRFRSRFDGAREYDLILRAPKSGICHIPRVLYHVRRLPEKKVSAVDARAALENYFSVRGVRAKVTQTGSGCFMHVDYLPDIFTVRKEIGVIGGKVLDRRGRIVGGMMDEKGHVAFEGLYETDPGHQRGAVTVRNADAVDARCMRIRPELCGLYQEVFGSSYHTPMRGRVYEIREKSLQFCERARAKGYLILWDPDMTVSVTGRRSTE